MTFNQKHIADYYDYRSSSGSYGQDWRAYTMAQTEELTLFDVLLKDLLEEIELPLQKRGRKRIPLKDQLFCAIKKVYSQNSSRRAASLYRDSGTKEHISKVPKYNIINMLLNKPELELILQELVSRSAEPLVGIETKFAIDSTGFRTRSFGAYCENRYPTKRAHKWLKAHVISGISTHAIVGIRITGENGGDSPQLEALVKTAVNGGFTIEEIVADKAYCSRNNYEVVRQAGGIAYIDFHKNYTGRRKGSPAWSKMYHLLQLHPEEFMRHYHQRSNAESTFAAIKKKLGETLKSKNPIAQMNELLCKAIAYNITVLIRLMFELGIKPDFSS